MALSEKGKSDRRLHYLITGCPFRSQLCETQKNKGETFDLAVAGTVWKNLDWGHGTQVTLIQPFSSECLRNGMANVWRVSYHSVLMASDGHCCSITASFLVTRRERLLNAGLFQRAVPTQAGDGLKGPVCC